MIESNELLQAIIEGVDYLRSKKIRDNYIRIIEKYTGKKYGKNTGSNLEKKVFEYESLLNSLVDGKNNIDEIKEIYKIIKEQ